MGGVTSIKMMGVVTEFYNFCMTSLIYMKFLRGKLPPRPPCRLNPARPLIIIIVIIILMRVCMIV